MRDFRLIHLADFPEASCLDAFARFADENERASNARIANPSRRRNHARAHGGLRLALTEVLGRPVVAPFRQSATGKPALDGGPWFSLSHVGESSWLAISDAPIGLDVVEITAADGPLDDGFVSAADRQALASIGICSPGADRVAWAIKEACAKLADDVWRPPVDWRLVLRERLTVLSAGQAEMIVELREMSGNKVAAVAVWKEYCGESAWLR
ncbi:MAG: hypothetical protein J7498_00040 [Sphingobium sp.]|nr:hypothetical protein [Sphingobium sp.]